MPSDNQDHPSKTISAEAAEPEKGASSPGPVTEEGDGHGQAPAVPWAPPWYPGPQVPPPWYQGPPPAPPARPPTRAYVVIIAAVIVLLVCGIGIGIGYAVFHSTAPTTVQTTTPTTTPTSPKVAAVAAKVDPGLVDVDTTLSYQTVSGAGIGMVVTSTGEVFTNNHVIEDETSLHVTDIGNGKTYTATVVGYDVTADISVLQITGASHLRTVSFTSAPAKVGEAVVAIVNAQGKGGTPSAVSGTVIGLDQTITAANELSGTTEHLSGMIETDAPIQAGDSGGPLVNATGEVLGMDTAGSSRFAFSHETTEGFAIPIATVKAIGTEIERSESSSTVHIGPTAFLGVEVTNVDTTGAVVVEVLPGTAATAIGLGRGDTITSLDGDVIRNPTTLSAVLEAEKPGTTIPISWQNRFDQSYTATVTLRSGPPA